MSDLAAAEAVAEMPAIRPVGAHLCAWVMPGRHERWDLPDAGGPVTVGRSSTCDVCITGDPRVSRVHVRLECVGGQWTLVDDGLSANGTFVNGRRVSGRVRLHDRAAIRVGGTVLTFYAPEPTVSDQTVVGAGLPTVQRLTDPQRRVLAALCRPYRRGEGYPTPASNQQIADELFLSLDAVKTHLRVLYHKFGIEVLAQNQKRARLAELALQLGLVSEQ
jgi:DNA-binding CsgD family transcriptional regulator